MIAGVFISETDIVIAIGQPMPDSLIGPPVSPGEWKGREAPSSETVSAVETD